jgi:hypothetical protein
MCRIETNDPELVPYVLSRNFHITSPTQTQLKYGSELVETLVKSITNRGGDNKIVKTINLLYDAAESHFTSKDNIVATEFIDPSGMEAIKPRLNIDEFFGTIPYFTLPYLVKLGVFDEYPKLKRIVRKIAKTI